MSLASFVADQCIAYLLKDGSGHLRPQGSGRKTPLQPPWSPRADLFRSLCTGCGKCVVACPHQILAIEKDGLPAVDFSRGFCTFCGECARSCPTEALSFDSATPPWDVRASVSEICLLAKRVLCRTCGEHCPQEAIVFPPQEGRRPEITVAQCDGCGACCAPCPVGAISCAAGSGGSRQ